MDIFVTKIFLHELCMISKRFILVGLIYCDFFLLKGFAVAGHTASILILTDTCNNAQ